MKSLKDFKGDELDLSNSKFYGGLVEGETFKKCWEDTCIGGADTYYQISADDGTAITSWIEEGGDCPNA